ncbi:hypothetical protein QEN19_002055 [Hanseniaspora menglaensis]
MVTKVRKNSNSKSQSHEIDSSSTPFISKNVLFGSPQKLEEEDYNAIKDSDSYSNFKNIMFDVDKIDIDQAIVVKKQLTKIQILLRIFRTTKGKDKSAKLIKYFSDLTALILTKFNSYRMFKVQKTVQDLIKFPKLSFNPSKAIFATQVTKTIQPSKTQFFGNEGLAICFTKIAKQMAFFRHSMRFGWTYFNAMELYQQVTAKKNLHAYFSQFSESDFSLFLELYYNIVDDLLYMHKLNIWDNSSLKTELDKHDARSWYYQIILSLKSQYIKYCELNDMIMKKEIKRDMLLENKDNLINKYDDAALLHEIDELYKELDLIKLDLYRLGCDFAADSIDVFNLNVPKGTYAFFSFISGIIGFKMFWSTNKYE